MYCTHDVSVAVQVLQKSLEEPKVTLATSHKPLGHLVVAVLSNFFTHPV